MEFDCFVEHLGNIIHIRARNSVEKVIRIFNTKVNALIANFWFAPIDVKYRLFIAHCMPLYGAQLWDYDSVECERFFIAWRKAVRKLLHIPARAHCNRLSSISNWVVIM